MVHSNNVTTLAGLNLHSSAIRQMVFDMHLQKRIDPLSELSATETNKCIRNIDRNIAHLEESVHAVDHTLFSAHVAWTTSVLKSRNKNTESFYDSLNYIDKVCKRLLPSEDSSIISDYIFKSIIIGENTPDTISFVARGNYLHAYAQRYLGFLLIGNRKGAYDLIHELVGNGIEISDIYEQVFQVSQYEVGRLWEINKLSVAQEHFCTSSTQLIMASLYEKMFNSNEKKGVILGCSADDELHELGIRMVTDLFEMDGWDTYYMGANMPAESIVAAIKERRAHVLAISATMSLQIGKVRQLIKLIKEDEDLTSVKIIVGGAAFNKVPDLWIRLGADATATNAKEAIAWANNQL